MNLSLKNVRMSFKMFIIVLVAVLGMAVLAFSGYRAMKQADADLDNMYNRKLTAVRLLGDEVNYMRMIQVRIVKHILDPSDQEIKQSIGAAMDSYEKTWPEYKRLGSMLPEVAAMMPESEQRWDTFKKGVLEAEKLAESGDRDAAWQYYKGVEAGPTQELLKQLLQLQKIANDNAQREHQGGESGTHDGDDDHDSYLPAPAAGAQSDHHPRHQGQSAGDGAGMQEHGGW